VQGETASVGRAAALSDEPDDSVISPPNDIGRDLDTPWPCSSIRGHYFDGEQAASAAHSRRDGKSHVQ
jgi:hypothetical protein